MGLNTLLSRAANQIISYTWFNDFREALTGTIVGRNATTGAPEAGKDLGSSLIPFGTVHTGAVAVGGSILDLTALQLDAYKIISGASRGGATSKQSNFLKPVTSSNQVSVLSLGTGLVFEMAGTTVTIPSTTFDTYITGLTAGGTGAANTALWGDTDQTNDTQASRTWGEAFNRPIMLTSVGANITARVGRLSAFKVISYYGGPTNPEYFIANVKSASGGLATLDGAYRGYFYNAFGNPVFRQNPKPGDTVTLLSLGWVFAHADGTFSVHFPGTSASPAWSTTQPTSPILGDYWYDIANKVWKQYNGSAYAVVTRMPIGLVCLDSTGAVGARSFDFALPTKPTNTIQLGYENASTIRSVSLNDRVNVAGVDVSFGQSRPTWVAPGDIQTGTFDNYFDIESTYMYTYVSTTGKRIVSDMEPYWRPDLQGFYHPYNMWRCVGRFYNYYGAASDIDPRTIVSEATFNSVSARYTTSAAQGIPNAGSPVVNFNTLNWDTHRCVTTGSSWFFRAPVAGRYLINAQNTYNGTSATYTAYMYINVAGATQLRWVAYKGVAVSYGFAMHLTGTVFAQQGDAIHLLVSHDNGAGTMNFTADHLGNWMSIDLIQPFALAR